MNFSQLIQRVIEETTQTSLGLFAPELVLCLGIVSLLLFRMTGLDRCIPTHWVGLGAALTSFGLAYVQYAQYLQQRPDGAKLSEITPFFTGLLVYDEFTVFFRLFLLLFLILVIALTVLSGIPDSEDSPDFYTLLLGSTVGMMMLCGANHLLILFLGIEMTSVPSYAMVGFLKGKRKSSEAALKYVIYGAGSAGVMLYGISLLTGLLGTGEFPLLAQRMTALFSGTEGVVAGMSDPLVRTVVLAVMMIFVGLAFKLSLVPFHFWCPDAFEGASAEVAGFLSVASKAAAFAVLVRFVLALVGDHSAQLTQLYLYLGIGLGVVAAVSTTFGNLAAYSQKNAKRLLAYSTIAHAGYMVMAVSAMMVLLNDPESSAGRREAEAIRCIEALLYYLAVYMFMNLGAFAIVALIRNQIFSEEISDYDGIASQCPILCACMFVCLFSLVGLPPLGGFIGKVRIFMSIFEATKVHWSMWLIFIAGAMNTVFSLFFYLRILKAMYINPRPEGARKATIEGNSAPGLYVLLVTLPVLIFGVVPPFMEGLSQTAHSAATVLFR